MTFEVVLVEEGQRGHRVRVRIGVGVRGCIGVSFLFCM
jgi:hypothetical protein